MGDPAPSRIFAPGLLAGQVCVVSGAGTGIGRDDTIFAKRDGTLSFRSSGERRTVIVTD